MRQRFHPEDADSPLLTRRQPYADLARTEGRKAWWRDPNPTKKSSEYPVAS